MDQTWEASKICSQTSEVVREDSLQIGGLHGPVGWCSEKDLLQCTPRSTKVEQEQLHQSRLGVRSEDLLQTIQP